MCLFADCAWNFYCFYCAKAGLLQTALDLMNGGCKPCLITMCRDSMFRCVAKLLVKFSRTRGERLKPDANLALVISVDDDSETCPFIPACQHYQSLYLLQADLEAEDDELLVKLKLPLVCLHIKDLLSDAHTHYIDNHGNVAVKLDMATLRWSRDSLQTAVVDEYRVRCNTPQPLLATVSHNI